ncbi:zinc-binding dehydrogenase [Rhizorhabdus histidinilytica]
MIIDHGDDHDFRQAVQAARTGAVISLVGGAANNSLTLNSRTVFTRLLRVQGIAAGSTAIAREMFTFIERHRIVPVIGKLFDYEEAAEAFDALERGDIMGNICLSLAR